MWRVVLFALGACGFSARTGNEPVATDAPASVIDAAPDAPLLPCAVAPTGSPIPGGLVGPAGGNTQPDVVCATGELPIGFDFEKSNADSLISTHVRCGSFARDAATTITTTPQERVGDSGRHGTCIIGQITTVAEQRCPTGHVLVGISVNNKTSSYNSFEMLCQPLTPTMAIAGPTVRVAFPASGTDKDNIMSATCPPGTAILSFGLKSGCDQESLAPKCTALACH